MGNILNRALSYIQTATALAAVAIAVAGCAAANNATSAQASDQASSQGEQPYKTAYGLSSEGTTTDLYTEFFGPRQPPPTPATNVASAQPAQPVTAQPIGPVQQSTTAARPGQTAPATNRQTTAANRAPQPAYGQPAAVQPTPVQVTQQPAPPPPPPQEPDVPAAYGIATNGPTTDLYTAIFGPRRSNGQ